VLQRKKVVSIKNTLIFIDYSTNFGGGGVELMLTAFTNSLALDDGLDGPETVGSRSLPLLKSLSQSTSDAGIARISRAAVHTIPSNISQKPIIYQLILMDISVIG
jgi:hypothetical protein